MGIGLGVGIRVMGRDGFRGRAMIRGRGGGRLKKYLFPV